MDQREDKLRVKRDCYYQIIKLLRDKGFGNDQVKNHQRKNDKKQYYNRNYQNQAEGENQKINELGQAEGSPINDQDKQDNQNPADNERYQGYRRNPNKNYNRGDRPYRQRPYYRKDKQGNFNEDNRQENTTGEGQTEQQGNYNEGNKYERFDKGYRGGRGRGGYKGNNYRGNGRRWDEQR